MLIPFSPPVTFCYQCYGGPPPHRTEVREIRTSCVAKSEMYFQLQTLQTHIDSLNRQKKEKKRMNNGVRVFGAQCPSARRHTHTHTPNLNVRSQQEHLHLTAPRCMCLHPFFLLILNIQRFMFTICSSHGASTLLPRVCFLFVCLFP